jgi:hypothetical protein
MSDKIMSEWMDTVLDYITMLFHIPSLRIQNKIIR